MSLVKITEELSQEAIMLQSDYKMETGNDITMPDAIILLFYIKNKELEAKLAALKGTDELPA